MRRLLAAGLGLALAVGSTAGCAKASPAGSGTGSAAEASASADGGQGGLGTGNPGEPNSSGGANATGGDGSPGAPTYPNDARAYAMAAINAWVNGQTSRLAALTSSGAAVNFANVNGHPDSHWQYHRCDGAAGSQYCVFRNNNGDQLQLRLTSQYLGQQHAVSEAVFDRTEYPASAGAYVSGFILAWVNDNRQRMVVYANSKTVDFVTHYPAPPNWTAQNNAPPPGGGYTYLFETSNDGFSMTFKVLDSGLGKPHAIQCAKVGNAAC